MSRILITDDSMAQRMILSDMVKAAGHETWTANNGWEALERMRAEPPDCLLLDLLMPEMDGVQLLEALKAENIHIPVIVISADIQEWIRNQCIELGAKEFLNKPPKAEALCSAIQRHPSLQPEVAACN